MMQRNLFPKDALPARLRGDFEAFWKAYPVRRPNPRALAEAAFARAVAEGAAPADLVRAAAGYAAEMKTLGTEPAFIVHAATFLRQRRFLDYLGAAGAEAPAKPGYSSDHALWPALRGVITDVEFRRWIEPLEVVSLSRYLLFFDARDPRQVGRARQLMASYQGRVKPILVGGSYLELMKSWRIPIYYDQHGLLTRRLGINHVPALVSQEGLRLRIDELELAR